LRMDEELKVTALVEVKQLPVIENQLALILPEIKQRCELAASLVVNEENYKEMKKMRAQLNKEYAEFKALIKNIKEVVMAPLNDFMNGICKEVDQAYSTGISGLDGNIKDTENGLKDQKREALMEYYDEYRQSVGLDEKIADPRKSGIKVGLSGSLKSYKEQVKAYLDRIVSDLQTIDALENRDEIMAEYRISLDINSAIQIVKDRIEREEAVRKLREEAEVARLAREAHDAEVEAAIAETAETAEDAQDNPSDFLSPPSAEKLSEEPQSDPEAYYQTAFRVTGTLDMLRALKRFLEEGGYEYESIKEEG